MEARDYDNELIQVTDFAIRVKNLPKELKSPEELRALLTAHFSRILGSKKD